MYTRDLISEARSKVVLIYSYHYNITTKKFDCPSTGSGFAVDSGEYILTCAHVVMNTDRVIIQLTSESRHQGEVTYVDESIDLAIIKFLDETKISPFKFEDCHLEDGAKVVAIGSPDSIQNTITPGEISNLRRNGREIGLNEHLEYVQHSAIIHPGNSGGPLVNPATGNVVAVNSNCHKLGLSFGISTAVAEKFIKRANKKRTRYTIGVSMLTVTSKDFRHFSLPETDAKTAVVLTKVLDDYPAATAITSLAEGDMVVRINNQVIKSAHDVYKAVRDSSGKVVTIHVRRQDNNFTTCLPPTLLPN